MSVETSLPELKKRLQADHAAAKSLSHELAAHPPQTAAQLADATQQVDAVAENVKLTANSVGFNILKTIGAIAVGALTTAGLTAIGAPHAALVLAPLAMKAVFEMGVDAAADAVSKSTSGYQTPNPFHTKPTPFV